MSNCEPFSHIAIFLNNLRCSREISVAGKNVLSYSLYCAIAKNRLKYLLYWETYLLDKLATVRSTPTAQAKCATIDKWAGVMWCKLLEIIFEILLATSKILQTHMIKSTANINNLVLSEKCWLNQRRKFGLWSFAIN